MALVKLRARAPLAMTIRMNNNQLVRDARSHSRFQFHSFSFFLSLSPHLRSPFRVAEVKEEGEEASVVMQRLSYPTETV